MTTLRKEPTANPNDARERADEPDHGRSLDGTGVSRLACRAQYFGLISPNSVTVQLAFVQCGKYGGGPYLSRVS